MACSSVPSQYSPFFASGLLSATAPRKVPTNAPRCNTLFSLNTTDIVPHFGASKSAVESSYSQQRRCSFLTLENTGSSSRRSKVAAPARGLTTQRSTPMLRQSSREKLSLPSAKPAPSCSLPDIPRKRVTRSTRLTLVRETPRPRQTCSKPSVASLSTPDDSYFDISPPPTPPLTASSTMSSDPSPRFTLPPAAVHNRSAALAALEGRSPRSRAAVLGESCNFISMSDDEDDLEERVLSSYFDDDSDDEDEEDDFLHLPESTMLPHFDFASETGASRKETATSFLSSLISFTDFENDVERVFSNTSSMVKIRS